MRLPRCFAAGILGHEGEGPRGQDERLRGMAAAKAAGRSSRAKARAAGEVVDWGGPCGRELQQVADELADSLLAVSVKPSTAKTYLKAVEGLHGFLVDGGFRFTTSDEKDRAIAAYLGWMRARHLAGAGPGVQAGSSTLSGYVYLFPEEKARLPRASRALTGWERNAEYGEGQPESDPVILGLMQAMRDGGDEESADALLLAHDAYLRESDFLQLRCCDVSEVVETGEMAIHIRYAKTGPNQGVRLDWSGTALMVRRRRACRKNDDLLFDLSQRKYQGSWLQAVARLQKLAPGLKVGPPHSVRHSGPSRDAASGYRTIWQIQRRGRWRSESSCMRYAKTASWTAALARTPPAVAEYAKKAIALRGQRAAAALE